VTQIVFHYGPILAFAAIMALISLPAKALTLQQAQNELAGMYCSGSTCTSSSTTKTSSGTYSEGKTNHTDPQCFGPAFEHPDFPGTCIAVSLSSPASTSPTCSASTTTTEKTLSYNGPNTSRDMAWSVDTSTSTSTGSC
jgi:hypothetical protein